MLTAISVAFTVTGPKLLGDATDVLVKGLSAPSGVNFDALGRALGAATFVYVAGALLSWLVAYIMAGVVQRSMSALRRDVEEKVHQLTLSYVDRTPRGDLMSRVTNDIDNIAQSVQMTQQPGPQRGSHLDRCDHHDALDLAAPGRVRPDADPLIHGDDAFGAASLPEALHRPMDDHRRSSTARWRRRSQGTRC